MATADGFHESLHREEDVVGPSARSFGFVFAAVFTIAGLLPLWRGGAIRTWALVVASVCGVLALAWPRALEPANRVWLQIGLLLHRIVNPVVMGVIFYAVVTPLGLVMRLVGKGLAPRLRPNPSVPSYWIARDGKPSSMDQQF